MKIHIPPEIAQHEPELQFFFDLMVRKLHINRHKGFVEGRGLLDILKMLQDEVAELRYAIENESQFDVALESVDVANMAFLLASICLHAPKDQYKEYQNEVCRPDPPTSPPETSPRAPVDHDPHHSKAERRGALVSGRSDCCMAS